MGLVGSSRLHLLAGDASLSQSVGGAIVIILAVIFLYALRVKYRPGLRQLPGPLLASISPLDRVLSAASGQQFRTHQAYHAKYGPVVRVGPHHVSFSNSDLIPLVYNITSRFVKVNPTHVSLGLENLPIQIKSLIAMSHRVTFIHYST